MRLTSVATLVFCLSLPNVYANLSLLKLTNAPTLPSDASHFLHPSLASFSIETAFFEEFLGNVTQPNTLTQNLLEGLKTRTGVPAEIRIGGITADSTYWNPNLTVALSNFIDDNGALQNTTLGPAVWDSVRLLPQGTKVTMTLVSTSIVVGLKSGHLAGHDRTYKTLISRVRWPWRKQLGLAWVTISSSNSKVCILIDLFSICLTRA